MLKTLSVWNFALIEHIKVEFDNGLNILTGETGAGKSILIDALGTILGGRASTENIRKNADYFRVEAVFLLDNINPELLAILDKQAIDIEDNTIIITRKLLQTGRGTILINGMQITLTVLKDIANHLMDIHGQNENLALLKTDNQYKLLDSQNDVAEVLFKYQKAYTEWQNILKIIKDIEFNAKSNDDRLDMLRWQEKEIAEAKLKRGEEDELEAELKKLSHAEKIMFHANRATSLLDEEYGDSMGIISALAEMKKSLNEIGRYDETLANAQAMIEEAYISIKEAAYDIRDYAENIEFNPNRLDMVQGRLDLIYRLEKKYGNNIDEILSYYENIKLELDDIANYDKDLATNKEQLKIAENNLDRLSTELTEIRQKTAEKLSLSISEQIIALGMEKAKFSINLATTDVYTLKGRDDIAILFSANLGEEPKPIEKIASGGELSRIALAIKAVVAASDSAANSMVFDEIDTGVGGRTAQMVAERVAMVARYKQVLCITHLPQIACMADNHFHIAKTVADDRTVTSINCLTDKERVCEIARMASGADSSSVALDNAREMLAIAREKKKKLSTDNSKKRKR